MRFALAAVVAVLLLVQIASGGLLAAFAAPVSLPRIIPHVFGTHVFADISSTPFAPVFVREATAATAIRDGDLLTAQRLIAGLPAGPARDDLEGSFLDAQGERTRAVAFFLGAGNAARVSAAVDALADSGQLANALALQRRLVTRLHASSDEEALAQADWRLAQLEAESGDHGAAIRDYRAALRLEPLSETYLLGAGLESLKQGHLAEAKSYYQRVVALDPASLDGHVGLGRVAARAGDMAAARREAAFVRARNPAYAGLQTLESEMR